MAQYMATGAVPVMTVMPPGGVLPVMHGEL